MENTEKFKSQLTAIADSIRAHTGSTDKIPFVELSSEIDKIEGTVSDEQVAEAVEKYFDENGVPSPARIGTVTLLSDDWVGDTSPYSQVVTIDGVTQYTQVDLTPSMEQLSIFYEKDLGFVTENDGGVVTVYAIGQKPTNDYTIQVTMTEVQHE